MSGRRHRPGDLRRSLTSDRYVSTAMRSTRLALPQVHNRDVHKLIDLIHRRPPTDTELKAYAAEKSRAFTLSVIQSVARRMGENWVRDKTDFAALSVSMERLHRLLTIVMDGVVSRGETLSFAILLQPFDDHLLTGAMLEARLRLAGYATRFFPDWSDQPLGDFDAVLICAANAERHAELESLVAAVRAATPEAMPVIVGGLGAVGDARLLGADLVTSSLLDAVDLVESRIHGERS